MEEEKNNTSINEDPVTESGGKKSNAMLIAGIALAVLVLVAGLAIAKKGSNNSVLSESQTENPVATQKPSNTGSPTITVNSESEPTVNPTANQNVKVINVVGGAYYFKPNQITVKKGETVKIVFADAGGMHDFVIDELNVRTPVVQSGETAEVEFTANTVGDFEYYCSVGNHRQMGMVGTLKVTN